MYLTHKYLQYLREQDHCSLCYTKGPVEKMYSAKHQVNPYEIAWYWLSKFLINKENNGST